MHTIKTALLLAFTGLAGCSGPSLEPVTPIRGNMSGFTVASKAFQDACIPFAKHHNAKTSFNSAKKYGVTHLKRLSSGSPTGKQVGFSMKSDISLQIDPSVIGGDCVVTTSAMGANSKRLDRELLLMVSKFAQSRAAEIQSSGSVLHVKSNNILYRFRHDTRGGEALVMEMRH